MTPINKRVNRSHRSRHRDDPEGKKDFKLTGKNANKLNISG